MKVKTSTLFGIAFSLLLAAVTVAAQDVKPPKPKKHGGVLNGKAVSLPKPAYPSAAQAVGASGAVNVAVRIDEEGNVVSANAVSGHPLLRQASEKAAMQAKFKPTMLEGKPVKVTGIVVYNFASGKPSEKEIKETDADEIEREAINDQAISLPSPEYPAAAKAVGAAGKVRIEVVIDEKGNVADAKAVSGHVLLRQASEKAAREAKFKPTLLNGEAVKVTGVVVYNFALSEKAKP